MNKLVKLIALVSILTFISIVASAQSNAPAPPTIAPSPSLTKESRCFEIRTYYAAPGKLEDLHA
ncbi:MAG: hypothetical protein ACREAB_19290, partial [Blastocatellia bacterium]